MCINSSLLIFYKSLTSWIVASLNLFNTQNWLFILDHFLFLTHTHTVGNPCLPCNEWLSLALSIAAQIINAHKRAQHPSETTHTQITNKQTQQDTPCRLSRTQIAYMGYPGFIHTHAHTHRLAPWHAQLLTSRNVAEVLIIMVSVTFSTTIKRLPPSLSPPPLQLLKCRARKLQSVVCGTGSLGHWGLFLQPARSPQAVGHFVFSGGQCHKYFEGQLRIHWDK